jgi:hypothetical protein
MSVKINNEVKTLVGDKFGSYKELGIDSDITLIGQNRAVKIVVADYLINDSDVSINVLPSSQAANMETLPQGLVIDIDGQNVDDVYRIFNGTSGLGKSFRIFSTDNIASAPDPIKYNTTHIYTDVFTEAQIKDMIKVSLGDVEDKEVNTVYTLSGGDFLLSKSIYDSQYLEDHDEIFQDLIAALATGDFPSVELKKLERLVSPETFVKLFFDAVIEEIADGHEKDQAKELLPIVKSLSENSSMSKDWPSIKMGLVQAILYRSVERDSVSASAVLSKVIRRDTGVGMDSFYARAKKNNGTKEKVDTEDVEYLDVFTVAKGLGGRVVGIIIDE